MRIQGLHSTAPQGQQHILLGLVLISTLIAMPIYAEPQKEPEKVDLAAMMARAKAFTQPSEHHELLKRFIGTWDTELRLTSFGEEASVDKGTATFSWLMEGRWLKQESTGTVMGMPNQSFMILGYDNFKQSYVAVTVGTFDTAMITVEGDLDPGGDVLIVYGTLDEYLTGEHDKMVKAVYRFVSPDKIVHEIHDLPIGEKNTKVIEMIFSRQRS